jgi:hypothetical protein
MKYIVLLLKLIFVALLSIFQIAYVSGLPLWGKEINLAIIFLVFSLEWSGGYRTIWWFFLIGLFFDLYFSPFFGFFTILFPFLFIFVSFLSTNFFTNRSLYSFWGMTFFATIFYYLAYNAAIYFVGFFSDAKPAIFFLTRNFWFRLADGLIINLAAVLVLFYLTSIFSQRLKPVFIVKKN